MSLKNLEYLMKPSSVALIGASEGPSSEPSTVGEVLSRNLLGGGFTGEIHLVNPFRECVAGRKCSPDVSSLPSPPDLAVIATPRQTVPGIVGELAQMGTRAAVIVTAGFGEGGDPEGKRLLLALRDAVGSAPLRIMGPNCLGLMVPGIGLNASVAHIMRPIPGSIAFVAQSGAVQTSVLDWAVSRGMGFSHLISLGDMADVDFGDILDYLAGDFQTRAILLYMEAITHARKFMSAARAAARIKPVIVLKAGRYPEGGLAVSRHIGAAAGEDGVCDAAFRRAGMLRVFDMRELFDAVDTLTMMPRPIAGDRLAVLTNGGGAGVIATDALIERGGHLAPFSDATMSRLNEVLPPVWSRANPVDILSDAPAERYAKALEAILDDGNADAVLVLCCPVAILQPADAARAVIAAYRERLKRAKAPLLLTSWLGERAALESRELFARAGIPTYNAPDDAVHAFMQMVRYKRNQEMLTETPPSTPEVFSRDAGEALSAIRRALAENREWLFESEVESLLSAYGIPLVRTDLAERAGEHGVHAGFPCLRAHFRDPDTLVPSLAFSGPSASSALAGPAAAYREPCPASEHPRRPLPGLPIRPAAGCSRCHGFIIRGEEDRQFGPVIVFGSSEAFAERVPDRAVALPPLNMHLARELISRTRIGWFIKEQCALTPAQLDEIALILVKVSQLVCDIAEIKELEINRLIVDTSRVWALNARIRVAGSELPAQERLSIRPYPKELEDTVTLANGMVLRLRPIRPEDEPGFLELFRRLGPEERRMRFQHAIQELSHFQAARMTQIDYDREMALVLLGPGADPESREIYGVVQLSADPDNERAEYAILVRGDVSGKGLGRMLLQRMIDYARKCGVREIFGQVLAENLPMLKVCGALGFELRQSPEDPGTVIVSLKLV